MIHNQSAIMIYMHGFINDHITSPLVMSLYDSYLIWFCHCMIHISFGYVIYDSYLIWLCHCMIHI